MMKMKGWRVWADIVHGDCDTDDGDDDEDDDDDDEDEEENGDGVCGPAPCCYYA